MQQLVYVLGGFAYLFLGMDRLSRGVSGTFAPKQGRIPASDGFLTGLFWTFLTQSSSAVTACLVSLSQAGIFAAADCFPVLLGANVGTTGVVWIMSGLRSAKLEWLSLLPAFAALCLRKKKPVSSALLGLSMVLVGMELLQLAAEPLKRWTVVLQTPLRAFVSGTVLTALLQSSAVTIGTLQVLPGLTMRTAAAAILGANIGTCVTGILASLLLGRAGRITAFLELGINVASAMLMAPLLLLLPETAVSAVQIAALHSLFNALTACVLLPLTPLLRSGFLWKHAGTASSCG